jgi:HTH-type transcriptional regulator, sugar sensing transcriptional regulator
MANLEQVWTSLEGLGLNRVEAEVYVTLVQHGPLSGYRVGQLLGRPDANVYKALASLANRRLALEQTGERKTYRATPFPEIVDALRADLESRTELAAAEVGRIAAVAADDWALYHVSTYEHAIGKASALFDDATTSILIDAPAAIVEEFRAPLERAAARGVAVLIKSYTDAGIRGATNAFSDESARTYDRWLVDWLNVVVDASNTIIVYFARDAEHSVLQGVWTESPYLSWTLHSTLFSEITMTCIQAAVERDPHAPIASVMADLVAFPLPAGHASVTKGFRKPRVMP